MYAQIMARALADGDFRALITTKNYQTTRTLDHPEGIVLTSTVLGAVEGEELGQLTLLGGKSGFTEASGQCWGSLWRKGQGEYIVVVLGCPPQGREHIDTTLELMDSI
ncbi:MAG: hypothetical protein Q4E76_05345 [Tissierellia bacterium]|nr:hypothetical protein [Tissierellia bacterium]